jgi:hypothetical protein
VPEEFAMEWISGTDVVLLLLASYVAVMALVRMMQRRNDELVADFKQQIDAHRKRPKRPKPPENKQNDQSRGAA